MKADPNKSLAQNVVDILGKLTKNRNWNGLKEWERTLLEQAKAELADEDSTD